MTARHPSVPNLIGAVVGRWSFVGGAAVSVIESYLLPKVRVELVGQGPMTNDQRPLFSHQLIQFLFVQILHYLADILRVSPGSHQQCVWRFHHDNIVHSDYRYELARSMNIISAGVQREDAL